MNTNLEQVLTETIVSSKKAVGEAVEWALKQVPDICDQYLRYEMISAIVNATIAAIFGILVIIVWSKLWKWLGKNHKNDKENRTESRIVSSVFSLILISVICLPVLVIEIKKAVKIYVAPKVYLVEFAAKLVK